MKAVERFRIAAGVPGCMCPAAVRSWQEPSHTVCRASTPFRGRRPLAPIASARLASHSSLSQVLLYFIPLQMGPSGCSRAEMRLALSRTFTGNPVLPASNPALSAILAAVQRPRVASALAGTAAFCSSARAERAFAPSPSRFQSLSIVQI